jgi:hypothetical protein
MAATKQDIRLWFDRGQSEAFEFMIVVCDNFDHEDYPVYCHCDNFVEKYTQHNGKNMQEIMEVYDLSMDREGQLNERRAFHYPKAFVRGAIPSKGPMAP